MKRISYNTIVDDHIGFGSVVSGPPDRPEPERPTDDDRLTRDEMLGLLGDPSPDVLVLAARYGLPPHAGRRTRVVRGWSGPVERYWSRRQIEHWKREIKTLAAALR